MRFVCIIVFVLLFSCRSIDVEKAVSASTGVDRQVQNGELFVGDHSVHVEPEIIFVERYVYIPQGQTPPAPPRGQAAVQESNRQGIVQPQDFSHAAMIYDYHRDLVYEVYTQPLRVTSIALRPGEIMAEPPFVSDSERFLLGAGVSYENMLAVQHVYVKPTAANLQATLIINTNERVYHIILRSFTAVHMPIVRWRYPYTTMPQRFVAPAGRVIDTRTCGTGEEVEDVSIYADPRFLSFDYRITHGLFRKPRWLPTLAYDDGRRTYIVFPETALQSEMPTVFNNRSDVVNFRLARNVMIIDSLVERVTVRLGNQSVVIEKKRGN